MIVGGSCNRNRWSFPVIIFTHLFLDFLSPSSTKLYSRPMDKEEFTQKLSESKMSQDEVDLLFHILDLSRDGYLYTSDFRSMESLAGYQTSHQLQAGQENRSRGNEHIGKE